MSNERSTSISTLLLSTTSIIIAAAALWVAVTQHKLAREHSRLSVQPRLDWRITENPDQSTQVTLLNVGLGPAVVRNVQLVMDGQALGGMGERACAALDRALERIDPVLWERTCFTLGDSAHAEILMRGGDQLELYHSSPRSAPQPPGPNIIGRLRVTADYCSLYDDCFTLSDNQSPHEREIAR